MVVKLFLCALVSSFLSFGVFSQELVEIKLIDSISVPFEFGSDRIEYQSQLTKRINQVKLTKGKIVLFSYTDTVGSNSYNRDLASKRILAVSKLIRSTNVKTFQIDTVNKNEERMNRKFNDESFRRVDILIYSVEPKIKFDAPINLRINFQSGTDRIVMSSTKNLDLLRMVMEMDTTLRIKLNGHVCCEPGLELSVNRAERVKSYLVMNGIREGRITCQGFSNNVKLVAETSEDNKRRNMRVEVVFVK